MVFSVGVIRWVVLCCSFFFFFKQKTAYEMRISDWSSDVCSSDLLRYGKGARSPKCCDRGIMRRSPPGASRWRRNTHGYGGRIFGSATRALGSSLPLARGDRRRTNEMNLIQTLEAEIGRASCRERVCQYV